MNSNSEMLNYIHQNAQMGQDTIDQILGIVEDERFKCMLDGQYKEYKDIFNEAEEILNKSGKESKEVNKLQQIEAYMMIKLNTLTNKSPDHISEMLMRGSVMGIAEITRRLKKYKNDVREDVYALGEKLLRTEERNLQECKSFIG